uniref:F-actin monooxygenase n=1 Tax=Cacopsylla melanoneura TaxID=428564 RepID=A0A8D8W3X7_9HEMI
MNHPHARGAKSPVPPEIALANDVFDQFCSAAAMKTILGHYRHLCDLLSMKPTNFPQFYPKLKSKLKSWKAQALWNKFDKRASHKCYNRGKTCSNNRVLIIGAGPCGLRAAIEAQLLGAKVVVLEKRDRFSRNNVLHLWPFVIHDLKSLGAKKFFGKFCAGSIDHISIRQLQCILMKVALILGVEIHEGVGFESLLPPPSNQDEEKIGWRAVVSPPDHPVSQYEFNVLIGADGKRNTLEGFKRKEFRGKLAIAITANFINKKTEAEARVEEISGVAFIFNQKFFKDLYAETGIDLENIVYYKDDTHYFVMTAKKQSLLEKGVILNDYADTARLLSQDNIDKDCLKQYARQAADFSTDYNLPHMEFAVNHYGQSDVAMFDFTSMYAAENACRFLERNGHKLLMTLVGDSLLEPFWPTGSGCARGFLSSMDACWAVRSWASGILNPLEVLAERESIYRILGQTTPENLHRDHASYSLDPTTRYPNLNQRAVLPVQVKGLYDTDDSSTLEMYLKAPSTLLSPGAADQPKKRRRREAQVHPDILLFWLKQQVTLYDTVHITDLTSSFKDGLALCAIIHRYRPDLIDFHSLNAEQVKENNQRAFDILEKELGIPSVMTGVEMEEIDLPDQLLMETYLSQIYETFRREIPHIQHPRLPKEDILAEEPVRRDHLLEKVKTLHRLSNEQKCSLLRLTTSPAPGPPTRKRHSSGTGGAGDKRCALSPLDNNPGSNSSLSKKTRKRRSGAAPGTVAARKDSIEQIEVNRAERLSKQRVQRDRDTRQFVKSMQMLAAYSRPEPGSEAPTTTNVDEDYGIFMYRQNAPDFKLRVKDIERKIFHPEREVRAHMGIKTGGLEEDISGRVRNLEEKFRAAPAPGMKPKDLYRAIGKIEKTDWNVKEIEKKIEENKYGKTSKPHSEKVPKWSHQQFVDKFSAVERKLRKKGFDEATASKYAQIDQSLKQLEQKIKEGNVLEQGQRGSNKVSALTAQLVTKTQDDKLPTSKPGLKPVPSVPVQSGSELCHFCNKRVYLMEMMNAEGRYFHRGCFRCEYCSINLRLGNYAFDREGKYGHRFFCTQHFGLPGTMKMRARRKNDFLSPAAAPHTPATPPSGTSLRNTEPDASTPISTTGTSSKPGSLAISPVVPKTPEVSVLVRQEQMERDGTPERIEIEVDGDEAPSVMDEDEWTDRNFGASCAENNSEESCDESSDEDDEDEEYSEALDVPLNVDETLRLAEDWTRKYGRQNGEDSDQDEDDGTEEDMSGSEEDEEDEELFSYQESDSEDDVSTATEGEEEIKAREARKQEVFLQVPDRPQPTDSDTEVYHTTSHPTRSDTGVDSNQMHPSSEAAPFSLDTVDDAPDIGSLLDTPPSDSHDILFESLLAEEDSAGFKTEDDSYDALEDDGTSQPGRTKSLDALDELPASESIENLFLGLHSAEVTKSTENFFTEVESLDKLQRRLHYGDNERRRHSHYNDRSDDVMKTRRHSKPELNHEFEELYKEAVAEESLKPSTNIQNTQDRKRLNNCQDPLAPTTSNHILLSSDYSDSSRPVTPNLPVINGKILVDIKQKKQRHSKSRSRTPELEGRRRSRSKTPDTREKGSQEQITASDALHGGLDQSHASDRPGRKSKSRSQTPDNILSSEADTPLRDRRFKRLLNRSETPDITLNDSEDSLLDDTKRYLSRSPPSVVVSESIHLRKSPSVSRRRSVPQGVGDTTETRKRSRSKSSHSKNRDKSGTRDTSKSRDKSKTRDKSTSKDSTSFNDDTSLGKDSPSNSKGKDSKRNSLSAGKDVVSNHVESVACKVRDVQDVVHEKKGTVSKSDNNNNLVSRQQGTGRPRAMSQSKASSPIASPPFTKKGSQSKPASPVTSPPLVKKHVLIKSQGDSTPASPMFSRKERQTGPANGVNPKFDINLLQTKYFSSSQMDLSKPKTNVAAARSEFFNDLKPNSKSEKEDHEKENKVKIVDKRQLVNQYMSNDNKTSRENLSLNTGGDGKPWDKNKLISQYLGNKVDKPSTVVNGQTTNVNNDRNTNAKASTKPIMKDQNTRVEDSRNTIGKDYQTTSAKPSQNTNLKDVNYVKNILTNVRQETYNSNVNNMHDEHKASKEVEFGQPEAPTRNKKKISRETSKVDNPKDMKRQTSNKECIVM